MSSAPAAREAFETFVAGLDCDMLIVTAAHGEERGGCLVGFHAQASIDPPRFFVLLSERNRTFRIARKTDLLAVHLVPAGALDLAELFGGETGDQVDKLARCEWEPGPGGVPVLARCESWFAGRVLDRIDLGDHTGFLLEPVAGRATPGARGLRLSEAIGVKPGHEA